MKKFLHLATLLVAVLLWMAPGQMRAQLSPGDIAVIGVNTDNADAFGFVALVDIPANTQINFTDDGVKEDGTLRTTEGILTWSSTSIVTKGTVVTYENPSWSNGSGTSSGSLALSGSGDQVIAFTGTSDSPTYIFAVNIANSDWVTTSGTTISSNTSYLPTGLTEGTNAINVGSDDNGYYSATTSGTKSALLTSICNVSNWTTSNSRIDISNWPGPFSVSSGGGLDNPSGFTATASSTTQMDLSWSQNSNSDDVMIAYSSDGTFGTPTDGTSYAASDAISGGGSVIYKGSATSFNHTSLTSGTHYYYKAWSVDGSNNYSSGVAADATTYKNEPTNQAISFAAGTPTPTTIPLTWSDNDGSVAADGYLVMASTTASFTAPVDRTAQSDDTDLSDGSGQVNVTHGTQSYTYTGLDYTTKYYFKIYAYTNSGTAINYKTDGTVPTANATTLSGPTAWINEIHYDNLGADSVEFVEIVIENPGNYTRSDFQVDLYNGNDGKSYDSRTVDNFTVGATIGNYTIYSWEPSSIQNGPDGLALSYNGHLIPGQFLSYEGTFTAMDGPANGQTSTDMGVQEDGGSTPTGYSLQLTGSGTPQYSDFTWQGPAEVSKGAVNKWQSLSASGGVAGLWKLSAASTNWGTASNWDDGNVPTSTTIDVLIPTGASNYPVVNESTSLPALCNNLAISSTNASLTINPGKALTVSGDLTNSGTLTVASDATGNGSLIVDGTPNGNVTVQRYIPAYTSGAAGWHLVSVPFDVANVSGSGFDPTEGSTNDLYSWDESTNTWANYRANTFGFSRGDGYLMAQITNTTNSLTGTLENSDVTLSNLSYNASQGDGWQLLGNPFSSAVKWGDANWSLANIGGVAKVWSNNAGSYQDVSSGDAIPPTSGFFVQVTSATNSLTIPAADREHDATNNYKSTSANSQTTLKFKVTDDDNSYYNNNTLGFRSDATKGFDEAYDSHMLFSMVKTAPQIWTVSEGQDFSTNYLPQPLGNDTVHLDFQAGVNSTYHLTWSGMKTFTDNYQVILLDKKTGKSIDMRSVSEYYFTATTSDKSDRFVLSINGTTGIQQLSANNSMLVYAQGKDLYIKAKDNSVLSGTVVVNNISGQIVFRAVLNGTSQQVLQTGLVTGVYIVRMEMKNGSTYSQKIVIQ